MIERVTGNRTLEEDGLIVWGIDPATLGEWPKLLRDDPEPDENPISRDVESLIERYLEYEDDRLIVNFALIGKTPTEISEAFEVIGFPLARHTIRERLHKSIAVLSAGHRLDLVDRDIDDGILTEMQLMLWTFYRVGMGQKSIAETLGYGERFIYEALAIVKARLSGAGYGDLVSAVTDLYKAMARGGRGNISRLKPERGEQNGSDTASDRGTVPSTR